MISKGSQLGCEFTERVTQLVRRFALTLGALAACSLATVVVATPASAGTLDQEQPSSDSCCLTTAGSQRLAQTFTAGLTGQLDRVDLLMANADFGCVTTTPFLQVEIRTVAGGVPTGTVLAATTSPRPGVSQGVLTIPFPAPATVAAGTQYAIATFLGGSGCADIWFTKAGDPYPRGGAWVLRGTDPPLSPGDPYSDFAFKTYVSPTPTVASSQCSARTGTITGTAGPDTLVGTPGPDVIVGLAGRDRISGLGGRDLICGGPGRDTLKGGPGNDKLLGQGGNDKLRGGGARDVCKGGARKDNAKACEVEKSV